MSTADGDQEILIERRGALVQVILNRPDQLNALTLNMIRRLSAGLAEWQRDPGVGVVVFTGAGDRAFCAGGDIKASYRLRDRPDLLDEYFRAEYRMNEQLFSFPKPLVALMDGITMGGGFGVAGPCRYRVATARTRWAMPETGIGFFPDIGSGYFLARAPGHSGSFLAVTGMTIGPRDALYGGFATHGADSAIFADLMRNLEQDPVNTEYIINEMCQDIFENDATAVLEKKHEIIDSIFCFKTIKEIYSTLSSHPDPWAREILTLVDTRAPLSMAVALEKVGRSRGRSFCAGVEEDFILAQHFMRGTEFFEGVRAMLIDRDKKPRWQPAGIGEVAPAMVEALFAPTGLELYP